MCVCVVILDSTNKYQDDHIYIVWGMFSSKLLFSCCSLNILFAPEITKVIQNNTGMYTKESSQRAFKIPNNNFDVRFEKAHQSHM